MLRNEFSYRRNRCIKIELCIHTEMAYYSGGIASQLVVSQHLPFLLPSQIDADSCIHWRWQSLLFAEVLRLGKLGSHQVHSQKPHYLLPHLWLLPCCKALLQVFQAKQAERWKSRSWHIVPWKLPRPSFPSLVLHCLLVWEKIQCTGWQYKLTICIATSSN